MTLLAIRMEPLPTLSLGLVNPPNLSHDGVHHGFI